MKISKENEITNDIRVTIILKKDTLGKEPKRNLSLKFDEVKEKYHQPGAEVPDRILTKERFLTADVFGEPFHYCFSFAQVPLVIKKIEKIELVKEKK